MDISILIEVLGLLFCYIFEKYHRKVGKKGGYGESRTVGKYHQGPAEAAALPDAGSHEARPAKASPVPLVVIGNMTPKREFLTKAEIRKLERARLTGKEEKVRDIFLLAVYTGLRWSDLVTLNEADICGGIIRKRMYKTKRDVVIPVKTLFWGKGQAIIDRYQPITRLCKCVKCNSTGNRIIQAMAERLGIKKKVHFHLARKICSTMLSQLGLPTSDISTILGHAKMETTQKYYIFGKEEAMMNGAERMFRK